MSISSRSMTSCTNFKQTRSVWGILALTVLVLASVLPDAADARSRAYAGPGAYDGTWNVVFTTTSGNCSSNNSAPFNVSGTRVSSAGGGKVTGGIRPNGAVVVQISLGLSVASGSGRLVGNTGSGRWRGIIQGDRCSGVWRATRF